MNKILVTGGAGFIGSHVVDQLVEQGKEVLVVDNMRTGNKGNINTSNNVDFIDVDITQNEKLVEVFEQHQGIDAVIHLAAQSKVNPSLDNPLFDADININGTINLLECSRKNKVKKFIYASSAAVYGHTDVLPIREDIQVFPLSPYGVSKFAAEQYVMVYGRLYDIDTCALRFANVYGPRQSVATESGVITIFIEQLLKDEQPVIFGDGQHTRDFVYVRDVTDAIVTLLVNNKDRNSSVYNISTGTETSVQELLQHLCNILDKDYSPIHKDERSGDIRRSYLNNTKIMSDINWRPQTTLLDGLKATVEYYHSQ